MANGGSASGGVASGGASSGGSATGGGATGGTTGGSSSGGQGSGGATGGASSGGTGGGAPDADGDGVPDASDQCPGGDDAQDLNENGEIDECEPGWCHRDGDPEKLPCSETWGLRSGFCTLEGWGDAEPGECVRCNQYTFDCNENPSDGCEVFKTSGDPCAP